MSRRQEASTPSHKYYYYGGARLLPPPSRGQACFAPGNDRDGLWTSLRARLTDRGNLVVALLAKRSAKHALWILGFFLFAQGTWAVPPLAPAGSSPKAASAAGGLEGWLCVRPAGPRRLPGGHRLARRRSSFLSNRGHPSRDAQAPRRGSTDPAGHESGRGLGRVTRRPSDVAGESAWHAKLCGLVFRQIHILYLTNGYLAV